MLVPHAMHFELLIDRLTDCPPHAPKTFIASSSREYTSFASVGDFARDDLLEIAYLLQTKPLLLRSTRHTSKMKILSLLPAIFSLHWACKTVLKKFRYLEVACLF